jgi:hypothetical protein
MRAISEEEFIAISNWSSNQYFFKDHDHSSTTDIYRGVAEKYTF